MTDKRWYSPHDKYQENEHPYEDLSSPAGRPKQSSAVGHTSNAALGDSEQYERLRNGRLFSSIYSTQNAIIGDSEFPSLDEFDEYRPKTNDLSFMFMTMVHDGLRIDEDSLKYNRTQKAPEYIQQEKVAVEPEEQQQPFPQSHLIEVQSGSLSRRVAEPPEEPLCFFHEIYGPQKGEWTVQVVCEVETPPQTKRLILDKPNERCQFELEYYELQLELNSPAELTKELLIEGCEAIGKQLKQADSLIVEAKLSHNKQKMWCYKEKGEPLEDMAKEGHVPSKKLYRELLPLIEKQPDKALHSSNISYSGRLGRYVLDYLHPKRPGQTVTVQNCQRLTKLWGSSPEIKAKIGEYQLSEAQFATSINGQKYSGRFIAELNPEEHYLVGSGTYGKIFIDRTRPSDVVKKRIYYTPANYRLCRLQAINELCMLRVCSSFLSAEVTSLQLRESSHFFEFELERCLPLTKVNLSSEELDSLALELESNLRRMHELGIYHRDIKPDNIMYSRRLKRLVLIDFGLSLHPIKQYAGKHFTTYCGTKRFMSDEMALLEAEGAGFVDLADNDRIALRKSLEMIKQSNLESQYPTVGLEEAYLAQGSLDEVLKGVVLEKDVDRRGQRGSIFSKMSKLGLVDLIERTAAAIAKLASAQELFQIVRLLIKHRIGGYSLDKLKDKLEQSLSYTDEEYFQQLKVEYEILTSPIPEALERCRKYLTKPDVIWIRKRYMVYEVLRNISTSDLRKLAVNVEQLVSLYDPAEGTVQLNAILLNIMSAVAKASDNSNPIIDGHMKGLASPLLHRIRTIGADYPNIADPLFRILQEINFKDSTKVQQIHFVNLQANSIKNLSQNSLITRRVLFAIYNNNCENETLLFQELDSMFLHENGLGQSMQYSHPQINQIVEDIPSVITRASSIASNSLLSMSLFQQDIIQTRNILLLDYKRPTPFQLSTLRVLVGDLEVTLQYRISLIGPAQEDHLSVFLRGNDIAVDVRKHPLADQDRDSQIQQFIRDFCIAKILSEQGVGTKLFKLMGCDFIIHPQCISYLASHTVKAGSDQRQQCQRDIAQTVDYLHRHSIAVRNISPNNLGFNCHLQRYVLTDFSRARGVTSLPSDPNSGRQSYTEICGNEDCLGDQMRSLLQQHELTGNVDLFLNDKQALQLCMKLLERLPAQSANVVEKPKLNHIQYQLKVLLAEQSGNIKWIVQSVNHYLTQHPDFFEKQIQFDYESFVDTTQPPLLSLVDRVQSKMKNKYAIQVLSLRSNFLLDESFLQISTKLYSLVVLDLSHNGLTSQSAISLTQQKIPLLRTLVLYDNCIGNEALSFLSCGMSELRELNLGCNQLTTLELEQQVTALSIERLDVSWNTIQIDVQAVELLARLPGLNYLNLEYTHSTLEQINKLFPQAIREPTLRRIKLTLITADALETAYLSYENGAYYLHHTTMLQNGEVVTTSTEQYEPHQQTRTVIGVKSHH